LILKIRILLIRDKVIGKFTIVQALPIRFKATNLSSGANCEYLTVKHAGLEKFNKPSPLRDVLTRGESTYTIVGIKKHLYI